jgi:hypothetical protein
MFTHSFFRLLAAIMDNLGSPITAGSLLLRRLRIGSECARIFVVFVTKCPAVSWFATDVSGQLDP